MEAQEEGGVEPPDTKKHDVTESGGAISAEAVDAEAVKVKTLSLRDKENEETEAAGETVVTSESSSEQGLSSPHNATDTVLIQRKRGDLLEDETPSGSKCSWGSNSTNRRYRIRHLTDESSNDSSAGPQAAAKECSGSRPCSCGTDGKNSGNSDEPVRKCRRHNDEAERSEPANQNENDDSNLDFESPEERLAEPALSFVLISGDESNDNHSAHYHADDEEIFGIENVSSSSDSSVIFADTTSSSSDTSLEDLEDREHGDEEAHVSAFATEDPVTGVHTLKSKTEVTKTKKTLPELPKALCKPKPKETWNGPKALLQREMGGRGRQGGRQQAQSAELFRAGFYGSLFSAERLELMSKLDGHKGCVNCLNFNYSGTKLASGSDDLDIKIWNYNIRKCSVSFSSGHRANVFQAKFLPFVGMDTVIASCARDNQVRLNELSSSGEVRSTRKLAQHKGPAHKLSISADTPNVILSCGEDSVVFSIDTREEKPSRLLGVREGGKKVALYSIHQNPFLPQEFCVSGKDSFVRIYDIRNLSSASVPINQNSSNGGDDPAADAPTPRPSVPLKKFCPHHLVNVDLDTHFTKTNVTAAVYNYNGKEILASYNDEHIYLFDTSHSDNADAIHKYEGHRNNATVKGVNFFGDRSQFVVSGSDDGHVFVWDKNTECIVNFFRGDENGVVNCLEGHPTVPILATSGLDDDIKIWVPSHETPPKMADLISTVKRNIKKRENESRNTSESDGFLMWALLNQMRAGRRNRRGRRRHEESDSDTEEYDFDSDDDDDDDDQHQNCSVC